jgi:hypothetical protein
VKISEELRNQVISQLDDHLSNLRQERHEGLSEYHFQHPRQFEFAQQKDEEILEVEDSIKQLGRLD